ncbi:MAG: hypothetical protein HY329_20885 [Chloroflexi bacterium]|nr:hypothetical protein [Chloroflexota bacterium]
MRPYFSLADSLKVCREEGRVLKWVADQLVDDVELRRLLRSGLGLAEIADHFDVIPDLITFKCRRLAWG